MDRGWTDILWWDKGASEGAEWVFTSTLKIAILTHLALHFLHSVCDLLSSRIPHLVVFMQAKLSWHRHVVASLWHPSFFDERGTWGELDFLIRLRAIEFNDVLLLGIKLAHVIILVVTIILDVTLFIFLSSFFLCCLSILFLYFRLFFLLRFWIEALTGLPQGSNTNGCLSCHLSKQLLMFDFWLFCDLISNLAA